MKNIYGLLVNVVILLLSNSVSYASEETMPKFDNGTYLELKTKTEAVNKTETKLEIKAVAEANQKIEVEVKSEISPLSFNVLELGKVMSVRDYNKFLDSMVIEKGELKCADEIREK